MRVEGVTKKYLDATQMEATSITDELVWPNEISAVPDNIFALPMVWTASTGFFLAGKNDGEVALMSMTDLAYGQTTPVTISSNPDGILWYYHRVEWFDMNGDGCTDAVTERANGGGPAADITQLIWLENPCSTQLTPNWDVHVLTENTEDVYFRMHEMELPNGLTTTAIISSGFYSHLLTIVWSNNNDFTDASTIQTLVIDNYGWYFDVEMVDINMDGKLDILTSTWSQTGLPGAVLAYEIPDGDWTTEPWPMHILQDGYKSFLLAGSGSPGTAFAFWPTTDSQINKPFIMVSGDDDGSAYVLTADSEEATNWSYTQTTIYKGTGTVGGIGVQDVDGDGFTDIFIPAYTTKEIVVMTYAQ
uniref:VCBS repeat-containing protein n=1 Tax=Ciona savignyi TaxID=51511 RepID=H2Z756_CIOSA